MRQRRYGQGGGCEGWNGDGAGKHSFGEEDAEVGACESEDWFEVEEPDFVDGGDADYGFGGGVVRCHFERWMVFFSEMFDEDEWFGC